MKYRLRIISWGGIMARIAGMACMLVLASCVHPTESTTDFIFQIKKASHAEGFQWRMWQDAQQSRVCLEIRNPGDSTILATVYRDSATWSSDAHRSETAVVLGPPERGLATLSTTHLALISAWDSACFHWSGGAYTEFIRWEPALGKLARSEAQDIGGKPEVDREKLLALRPAALTTYPFGDPLEGVNVRQEIPVVSILEYLESHPLGRAEWMRVMGWMMGELPARQADVKFQQVADSYERLRLDLAQKPMKPRVFTGSVQQGTWHAPGSKSFIARLLADAGLDYIVDADSERDNVKVPLEEMIVLSQSADAWGLVLHHPETLTRASFLDSDERHAMLLPPTHQVFVANTAQCDYFGWWVARPDVMLENLVALFDDNHPWSYDVEPCFEWIAE
jgi:iron complex transport system substrate-binding protein